MFNSGNCNYSLADIAAATGNNGAFGGDGSAWWIIILFLFMFCGWGGNAGAGLFGGTSATASGITDGYILTSDFASLERQMDNGFDGLRQQTTQVANGISSLGYDQLNQMNGINTNINNATRDITAGITALGNQMQTCCCTNRNEMTSQFAQLNYNLADQSCQTRRAISDSTRDIMANQDANTRSILDFLTQDKIATLTAENASLKAAASNMAQTNEIVAQLKTPTPMPAYIVSNPYCNCNCGTYA